ncbi:hypothetical protein OS175_00435 [Marinicella sp. S1101]|uniref:hypothetical protein n=1 Tax=Marinicella marina TaxID=2996016 RepID=UPI002260CC7B|nr:hypothetical protein [Marinicella marina]MCX7552329.1 hypothetical protein [Marinicella marina]MDJ1139204.1 hypothetical protein [Marinicella marina]
MGLKHLTQLIFIVLLAAVIWFWQSSPDGQKNLTSANTISRQDTEPNSQNAVQPVDAAMQATAATTEWALDEADVVTAKERALTYLDVYRMWRKFSGCQEFLYRLLEEEQFDPVAAFSARIRAEQKATNPQWPSAIQIKAVVEHAASCQYLLRQMQALNLYQKSDDDSLNPTYIQLRDRLRQYLSEMTPKSPKEMAIADALSLAAAWQNAFDAVLEASKGDDTEQPPEVMELEAQVASLEQERRGLMAIDRAMRSQQESDRIHEIWIEVRGLKQQIIQGKKVNLIQRNQAIAAFELINAQMFLKLRSQDPDVFFEVQTALEISQQNLYAFGYSPYKNIGKNKVALPFIEYVSPGEVIKNVIGIQDNQIFARVINHATKIYHCELGADCGPAGQWSPMYCHLGYSFFHEAACQADLVSFYQDAYMSENQWQDVQYVVNVLRQTYAAP